jgi:hypothetical protein
MNTQNKMQIKVFGNKAKAISEDDLFLARVSSVEGKDVVILERVN